MVILKKVKASTLMETLVATVLIVVIFMISSMILNNLFSNSVKNNTRSVDAYLNELRYLYMNEKLSLPYYNDINDWEISITNIKENESNHVIFEAIHKDTNKSVIKTTHEN